MVTRRTFLKTGAAGMIGSAMLGPVATIASSREVALDLRAEPGLKKFQRRAGAGRPGSCHYNQSIPGPLLRIPQGRESVIRFHNALDEPSSVHWHGMRIDNAMDGVPGLTQAAVLNPVRNLRVPVYPAGCRHLLVSQPPTILGAAGAGAGRGVDRRGNEPPLVIRIWYLPSMTGDSMTTCKSIATASVPCTTGPMPGAG